MKKKKTRTDRTNEKRRRRRKKKNRTANPEKKGKKKVKSGQKVWLVLFVGPSCVFNYKNVIELWVMEIENSQNVFSVSITHNSKIRELSEWNRVMETELSFAKQPFCYGSHHFELWVMKTENWVIKKGNPNGPLILQHSRILVRGMHTYIWSLCRS